MAFMQLIKTLQRNLQQVSGQHLQKYVFVHKRNSSTVSKITLCRHTEVVSSLIPASDRPVKTLGGRCFSLCFPLRNKNVPGDKDRSVSRYQSGAPKATTAQKGKTNHICRAQCDTKSMCIVDSSTFEVLTIKSIDVFQSKTPAEISPTWLWFWLVLQ